MLRVKGGILTGSYWFATCDQASPVALKAFQSTQSNNERHAIQHARLYNLCTFKASLSGIWSCLRLRLDIASESLLVSTEFNKFTLEAWRHGPVSTCAKHFCTKRTLSFMAWTHFQDAHRSQVKTAKPFSLPSPTSTENWSCIWQNKNTTSVYGPVQSQASLKIKGGKKL